MDCSHCPDFHMGCMGNYTPAQLSNMPLIDYLNRQKPGTEQFLCGKLRNIIIAEEVKLYEINKTFETTLKKDIGILHKDSGKCIVSTIQKESEIRNMEIQFQRQVQRIVEETNQKIVILQNMLLVHEQTINTANKKIEMQNLEIERLKNESGRT
jgi:hypothetical protein